MASLGWKGLKRTNDELVIGKAKKKKKKFCIFSIFYPRVSRETKYTHTKSPLKEPLGSLEIFSSLLEVLRLPNR